MKFELVLTYWRDGLFRSRDIISADNTHGMREQFDIVMDKLEEKIAEEDRKKNEVIDDDIPF